MATITVSPDLLAEADQVTRQDGISVDDLIADTLRQHLRERRREQIEAEARAFEAIHVQLLSEYRDQFVAIHDGKVVDHDTDKAALYQRVRARYGRTPAHFQQVTAKSCLPFKFAHRASRGCRDDNPITLNGPALCVKVTSEQAS